MRFSAIWVGLALILGGATHNLVHAAPSTNTVQDGIVALVNDEIILKSELGDAVATLRAQNPTQNPQTLQNQALDLLINRKLQLGIIRRANVTPNEAVINRQLLAIANAQGFSGLGELQQSLDSKQKGAYAALRNEIIEEAALAALWQHQMSSRVRVNSAEIDAFLASPEGKSLNQDEYRTTHVRVPFVDNINRLSSSQRQAALQVAQELARQLPLGDLQTAMQKAKGDYPLELQGADTGYHRPAGLPAELMSTITRLKVGEVSQPIFTEEGIDVVMLTDKRQGGTVVIPEWHTSHILVRIDGGQPKAIAEQKINALYRQLQEGADFATLAATYSDDSASASQQGSLDWVAEGQMVPEFEQMMKNTTKGDFSTPFQTQFGYHILKVNNQRTRDVSEEYRRAAAEEILISRLTPKAQEDWLQELRAGAYIKIIP